MERTTAGLERTTATSFDEAHAFSPFFRHRAYLLGSAALSPLWGKLSDMLGQFEEFEVTRFYP